MEYINLHRSVLAGSEFVGAEPVDRATWLMLLDYCCGQENGGVIEACKAWADRQWQQIAKVTKNEVERASKLWMWEGDDLVVNFYPEEAESQVKAMRRGGRIGNRKMQENRKAKKPGVKPPSQAPLSAPLQAGRSDNEMEWNEREGKGTDGASEIPSEETVLKAAKEYRGDMARAIPPVIPEGWALNWLAWRLTPAAGPFPVDWVGDLTRRFKSGWVNGDPRTRGVFGKNGAKNSGEVSASVAAIQDGKRVAELQAAIRAGKAEVENMKALGEDYRAEKAAVEKLMSELDGVKGGNA